MAEQKFCRAQMTTWTFAFTFQYGRTKIDNFLHSCRPSGFTFQYGRTKMMRTPSRGSRSDPLYIPIWQNKNKNCIKGLTSLVALYIPIWQNKNKNCIKSLTSLVALYIPIWQNKNEFFDRFFVPFKLYIPIWQNKNNYLYWLILSTMALHSNMAEQK